MTAEAEQKKGEQQEEEEKEAATTTATKTKELLPAPFRVKRLPPNFSFGEICASPKSQPTVLVDRSFSTKQKQAFPTKKEQEGEEQEEEEEEVDNNNNNVKGIPTAIQYHVLHTGSFVRVCTFPGRLYFLVQNANQHTTPDWKLHISCVPQDVNLVWNLVLLPLFLFDERFASLATIGMKALLVVEKKEEKENLPEEKEKEGSASYHLSTSWNNSASSPQLGREITIYLFSSCKEYSENNIFASPSKNNHDNNKQEEEDDDENENEKKKKKSRHSSPDLGKLWEDDTPEITDHWLEMLEKIPAYSSQILIDFVLALQQRLDFYGVRPSAGNNNNNNNNHHNNANHEPSSSSCADGDLALTRLVSVRNEAYVLHPTTSSSSSSSSSSSFSSSSVSHKKQKEEDQEELVYPPNERGWNAAEHSVPKPIQGMIDYFHSSSFSSTSATSAESLCSCACSVS